MSRGLTVPTTFTAVDRFSRVVNNMSGSMTNFVAKSRVGFAYAERGFRSMLSPLTAMNKMLAGLGVYVGLYTFIAAARHAIKTVSDFEQAQKDYSIVSGISIIRNKALADQARVLALRYGEAASSILQMDVNLKKLGFSEQQVFQLTKPVLTTATALKGVPDEVGKTMGAIMLAFKIPSSQGQIVGDILAKGADLSALDWNDLQTMLPIAMQSASLAWKDIEDPIERFKRLIALFATLRNAQVHVATGATGVKNLLIDSGIALGATSESYKEYLNMISQSPNEMKKAFELVKRRTLVSALPLSEAQELGSIEDFIKNLTDNSPGYAEFVSAERVNSIAGKWKLLGRSYEEYILSVEDGNGPLAASLKNYLDVTRAVLLMNSGSEASIDTLRTMSVSVKSMAATWTVWIGRIVTVVKWLLIAKAAMIVWRAVTMAATFAMYAFSISQGIMAAVTGSARIAVMGGTIAMNAYRGATMLARGATFLFSGAIFASPIGLFVGALSLLAFKVLPGLIDNYGKWRREVENSRGPMDMLIASVNRDLVKWGFMEPLAPAGPPKPPASSGYILDIDQLMMDDMMRRYGGDTGGSQTPVIGPIDNSSARREEASKVEVTIKTEPGVHAEVKATGGAKVKYGTTMVTPNQRR